MLDQHEQAGGCCCQNHAYDDSLPHRDVRQNLFHEALRACIQPRYFNRRDEPGTLDGKAYICIFMISW
jgi:hypothetical protein